MAIRETPPIPEIADFLYRLKKSHDQPKQFDREQIDRLLPTPALQTAFMQLDAATNPRESAIERKKEIVLEIRERNLIDRNILKELPLVYVGTGEDVEYPLLLGGRKIILVDPVLNDKETVKGIKKRIKSVIGTEPEFTEKEFRFSMDFGTGPEVVSIKLDPSFYGLIKKPGGSNTPSLLSVKEVQETETRKSTPDNTPEQREEPAGFIPPEKIGMLLGFRLTGLGTDIDSDPISMANVVNGGYVFDDKKCLSVCNPDTEEFLQSGLSERLKMVQEQWKERGFNFITLEKEGDNDQYTFLRKNSLPSPTPTPDAPTAS